MLIFWGSNWSVLIFTPFATMLATAPIWGRNLPKWISSGSRFCRWEKLCSAGLCLNMIKHSGKTPISFGQIFSWWKFEKCRRTFFNKISNTSAVIHWEGSLSWIVCNVTQGGKLPHHRLLKQSTLQLGSKERKSQREIRTFSVEMHAPCPNSLETNDFSCRHFYLKQQLSKAK